VHSWRLVVRLLVLAVLIPGRWILVATTFVRTAVATGVGTPVAFGVLAASVVGMRAALAAFGRSSRRGLQGAHSRRKR